MAKLIGAIGLIVVFIHLVSQPSVAATALTLQGRIVREKKPITSTSVSFLVQIRSPGSENCLLFQETHTLDMSASNGLFSLPIGSGTRASSSVDGGYTLQRIFSNRGSIDLSSVVINASNTQPCASGTGYAPSASDKRKLVYSFNDGKGAIALAPIDVTFNPMSLYALDSEAVGGFANSNFLRVENSGVPGMASALSTAQMTELMNIITGASVQYIKPGSAAFTAQPTFAGAPVNPSDLVNKAYVDAAASAGLQNVGTAGTYTKVTTDAQGRVVTGAANLLAADIPNLDASKITTGSIPDSRLATISTAGKINGGAITTGIIGGNTVFNSTGAVTTTAAVTAGSISTAGTLAAGNTTVTGNVSATGNVTATGTVTANTISGNALRAYNGATNYIELSAPVATSGVVNFKLPATDGSNGQVLKTDGAGNWGWISPSAGNVTSVTGTGPIVSSGGATPAISLNTGNGLTVNALNLAVDVGLGAGKIPQVGGSALGASGVVVSNGTGTTLSSLNCTLNQVIKFDASGFAVCGTDAAGTGDIVNGGNTTGAAVTVGTNDAQSLNFETNNATNMTILSGGNVGIGTTTPSGTFEVVGGTAVAATNGSSITLTAQAGGIGNTSGGIINLVPGAPSGTGQAGTIVAGSSAAISSSFGNIPGFVTIKPITTTKPNLILIGGTGSTQDLLTLYASGGGYLGSVDSSGKATFNTLYGTYTSSGNLTLDSTSNATKGNVNIAPTGGNVGIGTTTPGAQVDVVKTETATSG